MPDTHLIAVTESHDDIVAALIARKRLAVDRVVAFARIAVTNPHNQSRESSGVCSPDRDLIIVVVANVDATGVVAPYSTATVGRGGSGTRGIEVADVFQRVLGVGRRKCAAADAAERMRVRKSLPLIQAAHSARVRRLPAGKSRSKSREGSDAESERLGRHDVAG